MDREMVPYTVVTYSLCETLDILFVAGYSSCYTQVQILRLNLQPDCDLKLVFEKATWENKNWQNASIYEASSNNEETTQFATIHFHSKKYKWYKSATTWLKAEETCKQDGGHLVTINSHEELMFLLNCKMKKLAVCLSPIVFVGLEWNEETNTAQWLDKSILSVNYWNYKNRSWFLKKTFHSRLTGLINLLQIKNHNVTHNVPKRCGAMFMNFGTQVSWRSIPCDKIFTNIATFICEHKYEITDIDVL